MSEIELINGDIKYLRDYADTRPLGKASPTYRAINRVCDELTAAHARIAILTNIIARARQAMTVSTGETFKDIVEEMGRALEGREVAMPAPELEEAREALGSAQVEMRFVRKFVCSSQRIQEPTGLALYDEAFAKVEAALAKLSAKGA